MTNQLFQEVLDGRIPVPRRQARRRYYWLPAGSYDPTAPTMADLNAAVDITNVVTIDGYSPDPWPHVTPGKDWDEPAYVMPAPPYPTGNIATQKRRKRL